MLPRYIFPARSINEFVFRLLIFSACPCKAGRREKRISFARRCFRCTLRAIGGDGAEKLSRLYSPARFPHTFRNTRKKESRFLKRVVRLQIFFAFSLKFLLPFPKTSRALAGRSPKRGPLLFFISLHERFHPFAAGFFISCGASAYNRRNRFLKKGARSMRLYNEILKKFGGGEAGELFAGTRYTVLRGRGGYFQGV